MVAIDPAQMSRDALLSNVHHLQMKADNALEPIRNILGSQQADLMVADMNKHPATTARAMLSLMSVLRPGGTIIMTLKFYGVGREKHKKTERVVADIFDDAIEPGSIKTLWLLANSVSEATLVAVRA